MNKNIMIILLIFLVPMALYWGLTKDKSITTLPSIAYNGPEIIKFSSPMCYECQELEKIFNEIYPGYANKVSLRKIDVTQKDKTTKQMIKEYDVKLVPTCIFKNKGSSSLRAHSSPEATGRDARSACFVPNIIHQFYQSLIWFCRESVTVFTTATTPELFPAPVSDVIPECAGFRVRHR